MKDLSRPCYRNHTLAMQNWVSILNGTSLKTGYKGRWAAGSGPQAVEWAAGRGPQGDPPGGGRGQLLAKPKVPDNKTFGCFVECYLN